MEQAMRDFFFKAVKEQDRGDKADQIVIDAAFNQAATLAEKVAPFRHPRLATMKLSGHPNAQEIPDGMTAEELRAKIGLARAEEWLPNRADDRSSIPDCAARCGNRVVVHQPERLPDDATAAEYACRLLAGLRAENPLGTPGRRLSVVVKKHPNSASAWPK